MTRWMRVVAGLSLVLGLGALAPVAHAEEPGTKFLQARHRSVQQILEQKPAGADAQAARVDRLSHALDELLDLSELSRRALADHWDGISEVQRGEFVALLSQLVQQSYRKNLESTLDFAVRYTAESPLGDGVLVRTVARSRKNPRAPEVSIDYALRRLPEGFRVYDITTDGVSLVENYRKQFDRIIRRDGWSALVQRMQKKLAGGNDL